MDSLNILETWSKVLDYIEPRVSIESYTAWFPDIRVQTIEGNQITLGITDFLAKSHLESNYTDLLLEAFEHVLKKKKMQISFVLQSSRIEQQEQGDHSEEQQKELSSFISRIALPINEEYSFENFVVGSTSKLAYTASLAVSEKPGQQFNPIFITGNSGIGKTHLMHAIALHIKKMNPTFNVVYTSSQRFMDIFFLAMSDKKGTSFKQAFYDVDVLLIDDIQFFTNNFSLQNEFFDIFNILHEGSKQIVVTSDKPIESLNNFEDRMRTRFSSGVTANITSPDLSTRISILTRFIETQNKAGDLLLPGYTNDLDFTQDIIYYVAENFSDNVRSLKGAINTLTMYAISNNVYTLDLATARIALKDLITEKNITFENIQHVVSGYFNISVDDILSKSRKKNIAYARHIAIFLIRKHTDYSTTKIGQLFGDRDHTTIMHSEKTIAKGIKDDDAIHDDVHDIEMLLNV